jgi:hypothetical protein
MAEYEFTAEENRCIDTLRRKLLHVAILFLVLGALQLVQSFVHADRTGSWVSTSLAASLLLLGLGWLFIRPLDNFRRIVTTEGRDIREVVVAIKDLRTAYLGAEIILVLFVAGIIVEVMRLASLPGS